MAEMKIFEKQHPRNIYPHMEYDSLYYSLLRVANTAPKLKDDLGLKCLINVVNFYILPLKINPFTGTDNKILRTNCNNYKTARQNAWEVRYEPLLYTEQV